MTAPICAVGARRIIQIKGEVMKAPESVAMEHLGIAVAHLRAAASWLMDGERNMSEIADALSQAEETDKLMKAVAFNLAGRKGQHQSDKR